MKVDYPKEWDDLPRHERKKKIKKLKKETIQRQETIRKFGTLGALILFLGAGVMGYQQLTKPSPEELAFEEQVEEVTLDGKVETFPIEGRDHVSAGTSVLYDTNPPTSGGHLAQAEDWGIYDEPIDDKAAVHSLEHGGIWISYKNLDEESIAALEAIGEENPQSTVVSPRPGNDDTIAVASWGEMMRLDSVDSALIQKYIDTYKNQSPERLAR